MLLYILCGGDNEMALSVEKQVLISLLKHTLIGDNSLINNDNADDSELFEISDKHSVNMLAYESTKYLSKPLSADTYNNWIYFASRKMAMNEEVISVQKILTQILEKNNIKYFIFKGLCSAYYYNKPELRELGDIDFYIDFKGFDKADKILKSAGFNLISKNDSKHWHYQFNGVDIEMHYGFWDMPENSCTDFLNKFLKDTLNQTMRYNINNYCFNGPNPQTHSIIMIMHIINHLQRGGIGLRHLCDFAAFMMHDEFKNYENDIADLMKKGGILKTAGVVSKLCCDCFGCDKPSCLYSEDNEICELFFNDIISSGNFGKLSEETYYGSSVFTIDKSNNSGFLKSLIKFCRNAWEPCDKYKVLLPIAPFFVFFRYLIRMIMGKRPKISIYKFAKNGLKRADLYKNLKFYEESNE